MSDTHILAATDQLIGLRLHEGHFYKWSAKLNAWGMVDDQAASAVLHAIAAALNKLPFALALSAVLNAQGGSHAAH